MINYIIDFVITNPKILNHLLCISGFFFIIYFIIRTNNKTKKLFYKEICDMVNNRFIKTYKIDNLNKYYKFSKKFEQIFNNYKPDILPIYYLKPDVKNNSMNIKYLYELKKDKNSFVPSFKDSFAELDFNDFKDDLRNMTEQIYYIDDMDVLKRYDLELYNIFKKIDINNIYLVNLYKDKNIIGMFMLMYKDVKVLTTEEIYSLLKTSKHISEFVEFIIET